jgi:hypothetical protein
MEAQWPQRRQPSTSPFVAPASPAHRAPGEVPVPQPGFGPIGRPVTRVDFFRRMPVGGTAYLRPVDPEA